MAEVKLLPREDFRKMQLLELDMLVELDRVCRAHDIPYVISCGTMIGAVRHKGYIPWDDDADIVMLREDYERFKTVAGDLNPKICFFQDHDTDPEFLWGYGKLRRTGTSFVRAGQEHMKGQTGVFIDMFPLDDLPLSVPGQMRQVFWCYFLRKVLWSRVGKVHAKGVKKAWFELLSHIPVKWVYDRLKPIMKRSRNDSPNEVTGLVTGKWGPPRYKYGLPVSYGMPKSWFLDRAEYEFEGHMLYGTKDYDACLKYMYGDYMKLPPEDQRDPHSPVSSYSFDGAYDPEKEGDA